MSDIEPIDLTSSDDDNDDDSDINSDDDLKYIVLSHRHKIKYEQIEKKITNNIDKMLTNRYLRTNIHPTKDPAIIFLVRLLQNYLLQDDKYSFWYSTMLLKLENEYEASGEFTWKIKTIFNAIPAKKFSYEQIKIKKGKKRRRQFDLDQADLEFKLSLRLMQRMFEIIRYGAIQFNINNMDDSDDEKEIIEAKWRFIGNGIPYTSNDNKRNYTLYKSITNGKITYNVDDIIEVNTDAGGGIIMRPWIGRISQLFFEHGKYKLTIRWFWFYNQIVTEYRKPADVNAVKRLGGNYPPKEVDVFEGLDIESSVADEDVSCIKRKVYITYSASPNFKYIDGVNVFRCDFWFDPDEMDFVKKDNDTCIDDEKRLTDMLKQRGIDNDNNNDNNDNDDDDDLDLAGITLNNNDKNDNNDNNLRSNSISEDPSLPIDSQI